MAALCPRCDGGSQCGGSELATVEIGVGDGALAMRRMMGIRRLGWAKRLNGPGALAGPTGENK
jgi:hypothetical protein